MVPENSSEVADIQIASKIKYQDKHSSAEDSVLAS